MLNHNGRHLPEPTIETERLQCTNPDEDGFHKHTVKSKFSGENQVETISLLDERDFLVRDSLISYFESLVSSPFQEFILDSLESEQIPALIERDIPFAEFMGELGCKAIFNVVIGGGAYRASVEYLQNY